VTRDVVGRAAFAVLVVEEEDVLRKALDRRALQDDLVVLETLIERGRPSEIDAPQSRQPGCGQPRASELMSAPDQARDLGRHATLDLELRHLERQEGANF
jgi:hypothetical protein